MKIISWKTNVPCKIIKEEDNKLKTNLSNMHPRELNQSLQFIIQKENINYYQKFNKAHLINNRI